MRLRSATALAAAILLTTASAAVAATPDWESELFPAEYDRPGSLTISGRASWNVTGDLAGHPGNWLHTGRLDVQTDEDLGTADEPGVYLTVQDQHCEEGAGGEQTCAPVFTATGRADVERLEISAATGTLRVTGDLTEFREYELRPGFTAPPLDFDVTISGEEADPFSNTGPRGAEFVERRRSERADAYTWWTDGSSGSGSRATGPISGFRIETIPNAEGFWSGRYGDRTELSRVIAPPRSARNWVPEAGENGVSSGSAQGRWSGPAPATSTGVQLPGNAWSGSIRATKRVGTDAGESVSGVLRAWQCAPGEKLSSCDLLGHYRFTGTFRVRVDPAGRIETAGWVRVRDAARGPIGTLPLTLEMATAGVSGRAEITSQGSASGRVQSRRLSLEATIAARLGSLTLAPSRQSSEGPPGLGYSRSFNDAAGGGGAP